MKLLEYTNDCLKEYQPAKIVLATAGITAATIVAFNTISDKDARDRLIKKLFSGVKSLPMVQQQVKKERAKIKESVVKSFKTDTSNPHFVLPLQGVDHESLLKEMHDLMKVDESNWIDSKVSGCVYLGEEEHTKLLNEAYSMFSLSNPLHPSVFPSIRKFETETISMVANMLNAHPKVVGSLTSGGTESIFMAVKAYRDFYKFRTSTPEIVVPVTIHAAFDKACEYLKIKVKHIPVGKDYKVDIEKLRKAITPNTIMIAGSAVNFPHGIIDDIPTMAKIAQQHDIGMHVDACLGGFVLPFAEELGYDIPVFDFRIKGVTSMSIDTHKFGYATKGTSVVLFSSKKLRRAMYFTITDWPGGIYASPTLPGSRPGGLVAACWASLVAFGRTGFRDKVKGIMETTKAIINSINKEMPDIQIIGDPKAMVIAFTCDNIFFVNDAMSRRGWHLNALQRPNSLHICVTAKLIGMENEFIKDLKESLQEVQSTKTSDLPKDGTAPIYGTAHSIPDREMVGTILADFIDALITSDKKPTST